MHRIFSRLFIPVSVACSGVILFILFFAPRAQAQANGTITVDTTVDDNTANGNCTLREAIIAANTDAIVDACPAGNGPDTIVVPAGIYTLTITGSDEDAAETGDLDITQSLIILGAGASSSIIDAGGLFRVFHLNPSLQGNIEITIKDLAVRNGNSLEAGGILNNAELKIIDSVISENIAGGDEFTLGKGAGIYNSGSVEITNSAVISNSMLGGFGAGIWSSGPVTLTGSEVSSNSLVFGSGGGIYSNGSLVVFNSSVGGNKALEGFGGGIYHREGQMTIHDSGITNNLAGASGGIFYDSDLDSEILGSSITGNVAANSVGGMDRKGDRTFLIADSVISGNVSGGPTGGIENFILGELILLNSSVSGNSAHGSCGGIAGGSNVMITLSSIISNTASGLGGGLCLTGGSFSSAPIVVNSTISGNSTEWHGGGILIKGGGFAILNNVTIAQNTADANADDTGGGGGAFLVGSAMVVRNTIIASNYDLSPGNIIPEASDNFPDCFAGQMEIDSDGYNLIGQSDGCNWLSAAGDQVGTSANAIDPLLGPLQDNGGAHLTHALLPGSPAIDAGSPAEPGSSGNACEAVDQRGVARPQGAACDIGAIEFVPGPTTEVALDIQPGSDANAVLCTQPNTIIAVAIVTTPSFDARSVDHTTVWFEGAAEIHVDQRTGSLMRHERDVDGDGDQDLLFHFRLDATGLSCQSDAGTLTGLTFAGQPVEGSDLILMVDRRK